MRIIENIKKQLDALGFKDYSDKDINPEQLKMGIKTEGEHTTDARVARVIALAHLNEDPEYYTHLREMEQKYKKGM